jgi:hypothetical protein
VVELILGVVKVVPVLSEAPPLDAAYQFTVPALAAAPRVTVPVPHLDPGVVPVIVGTVLIVAVTGVLTAVVQPLLVAST